jgi:hypothetical protein
MNSFIQTTPKEVLHLKFDKKDNLSPRTENFYLNEGIELQGISKDKNLHKIK